MSFFFLCLLRRTFHSQNLAFTLNPFSDSEDSSSETNFFLFKGLKIEDLVRHVLIFIIKRTWINPNPRVADEGVYLNYLFIIYCQNTTKMSKSQPALTILCYTVEADAVNVKCF